MLKIIFYNPDLKQVKNICNNIINQFENLQIVGIATMESEINSLHKNTNADIIIYNYDSVNSRILKYLEKFKIKIIFYNNLKNLNNNNYTLYLSQKSKINSIQESIKAFIIKFDEQFIYQKVFEVLKKYDLNFKLNGTFYLINCIVYSYLNKDKYVSDNLEKNVYPQIAKQFNTTISTVKWAVIRATNSIKDILEPEIAIDKITPKSLINEIVNKIS